jgi:hypothetical protein
MEKNSLTARYRRFARAYCLHFQILKMEHSYFSETLVAAWQTIWYHNQSEHNTLQYFREDPRYQVCY